jgi:Tol biopolymer transport system component
MTRSYLLVLAFAFFPAVLEAQHELGVFDNHLDVGNPKREGSAQYQGGDQTYILRGSGYNIWFNRDEFQFAYKKIAGDFILTADFDFGGDTAGSIGHRKTGWMIRESTDADAAGLNACKHIDGLMAMQWRDLRGAYMRDPQGEIFFAKKGGQTIQLERIGKTITMRIAHPGEPLQDVGSHEMPDLPDTVLAGIYVCAHDPDQMAEARAWNLRIDKPVANAYYPNPITARANPPSHAVLGSRLEILDVSSGLRKIVYESTKHFEAPNWMPGGQKLLFNEEGSLYTIGLNGGNPEKLNTGSVNHNNNDHAISFDGKMLGISSHRQGLPGGGSTVYVLPLSGGEPRLITESTPSYLHGWNPNGRELAVVGQRNGSRIYNLYAVSIKDGKEIALTQNSSGHVDGSEYSPDGKYIYYNANVSGTMQIWRMRTDGSGKEQLTFDQYHNWFPHLSPDGKWIAFVSYPGDIDPDSHPSYKRLMIRLMPVGLGAPKVIAYLYGGQGTLNAPSWSPDSRSISFVSYSSPEPQ